MSDKSVTLRSDVHEEKFPEHIPMTLQIEDGEPLHMNLELNKRMNPKYVNVNFDGIPHKIPAGDRLHVSFTFFIGHMFTIKLSASHLCSKQRLFASECCPLP